MRGQPCRRGNDGARRHPGSHARSLRRRPRAQRGSPRPRRGGRPAAATASAVTAHGEQVAAGVTESGHELAHTGHVAHVPCPVLRSVGHAQRPRLALAPRWQEDTTVVLHEEVEVADAGGDPEELAVVARGSAVEDHRPLETEDVAVRLDTEPAKCSHGALEHRPTDVGRPLVHLGHQHLGECRTRRCHGERVAVERARVEDAPAAGVEQAHERRGAADGPHGVATTDDLAHRREVRADAEGDLGGAGRVPQAELLQMDARAIPFVEHFDIIGMFDVLEHIEDDRGVLEQTHRALRPGGGLIITVPQHRFLWSRYDEHAHHVRRYAADEIAEKVTAAGFRIIMTTSFVRIVVVLSLLRTAIGLQQSPPNAVIVSLSLFLTAIVMAPTFNQAYDAGVKPLLAHQMQLPEAFTAASTFSERPSSSNVINYPGYGLRVRKGRCAPAV